MSWLGRVGDATLEHRERRAARYERRGYQLKGRARLEGAGDGIVADRGQWHLSRAEGQRERIERVENCGRDTMVLTCQSCGVVRERQAHCRCRLLCLRCRGARAREMRARFLRARDVVLSRAKKRGLLDPRHRGGSWGERLITLTAPHVPGDSVAKRIERIFVAWARFVRLLQGWQRDRDLGSLEWLRVFEWTPGSDAKGHPHFHIWMFSPFVAKGLIDDWWSAALTAADYGLAGVTSITDIRAVSEESNISAELIKYLTKDIDACGKKIDPVLYAAVYSALDERRATQASCGFMGLADQQARACESCGSTGRPTVKRVKRVDTLSDDQSQAPTGV